MFARFALFVAVTVAACGGNQLHAEPFKRVQAQKVELGALTGVAYYTEESDGNRLVLTLQAPGSKMPFRVVATLAPGQTVTLSVPRGAGEPPVSVRFTHRDGQISIENDNPVAHLATD